MNNTLIEEQIKLLENDLDEFLTKAEKIIGHKGESIDNIIKELLKKRTKKSIMLANDIVNTQEDIRKTEDIYNYDLDYEDPFENLHDDDFDMI